MHRFRSSSTHKKKKKRAPEKEEENKGKMESSRRVRKLNEDVVTLHVATIMAGRSLCGAIFKQGIGFYSEDPGEKRSRCKLSRKRRDRPVFHYPTNAQENAKQQRGTTGRKRRRERVILGNIVRRECSWRYCASTATTREEWRGREREIE